MFTRSIYKFVLTLTLTCILTGFSQARAAEQQTLNAGWLLETARNVYLTSSPWAGSDCRVEVTGSPADITVYRDGRLEVRGVLDRTPNSIRDVSAVSVEVYVGGILYMRYDPSPYITVSVKSFRTIRDIDRGEILSSGDVQEIWLDVRQLPSDGTLANVEDIVGLAARTNIPSGRTITENMLELPTLVIRGESVIVSVPLGNAAITLRGIALDSGSLGKEIRVRNPDSNSIITATVSGQSRAEIRLIN